MTQIAVVTGANRGIGEEIARQLVRAGFDVITTARDETKGRAAADAAGARFRRLDVTKATDIAALGDHLTDGFDVLVNNAGVSFDGFDADVVRRTLEVNFFGAMNVTDRLLPSLRRHGRIVNLSSRMGELTCLRSDELRSRLSSERLERSELVELMHSFTRAVRSGDHERKGWPSSAYRVSKVGLNALTRVLGRELAHDPRGILVNAACPGWVATHMGGAGAPRTVEEGARTPVWLATLAPDGPTGGFFRDEEPAPW